MMAIEPDSASSAEAPPDQGAPAAQAAKARTKATHVQNPVMSAFGATLIMISLVLVMNPPWVGTLAGTDRNNYAFLQLDPATNEPVTWDHCTAIRYQVNPQFAPPGWRSTVNAAFEDVSRGSGFVFVDHGTTTSRTVAGRNDGGRVVADPVLVMWSNGGQTEELHGDVAGLGGSASVRVGERLRHITGRIVLDADVYNRLHSDENHLDQRLILEHEIGHVLGLDHVPDRHQVMYEADSDVAALGRGDLAGLQALHDVTCG